MAAAALGLAAAAFILPALLWVGRRLLGRIEIHRAGQIEAGYGLYGPALVLHGTLEAINRNLFVSDIKLAVERDRDGAKHEFAWAAFRGQQLGNPILELPAGYMIRQSEPHRYVIAFADTGTRTEMQPSITRVRQEWNESLRERPPADDEERLALYEEFRARETHSKLIPTYFGAATGTQAHTGSE